MKKIIALVLSVVMVLALAACGGQKADVYKRQLLASASVP